MMCFRYTFLIFSLICITYQSTFCMNMFNFSPKNLNTALSLGLASLPAFTECTSRQNSPEAMDTTGIVISVIGVAATLTIGCTAAGCLYCIDVSHLPVERQRAHKAFWLRICHTFGCYKHIQIPDETTSASLETVTIEISHLATE